MVQASRFICEVVPINFVIYQNKFMNIISKTSKANRQLGKIIMTGLTALVMTGGLAIPGADFHSAAKWEYTLTMKRGI
ncbi:hypothetical protein LC593_22410 [Nostoc sp. CHAB 5844]|nr:hypothetical protein [Nostoc sp. CHAB 5844]